MQAITIKMEDRLLEELDQKLGEHRYSTRTEFIRDAIREKLSELEKNEVLKNLAQLKGSSKRNTSDAQLHDARDKAFGLGMSKNNRVLTTDASEMRCTKAISVNLTQA